MREDGSVVEVWPSVAAIACQDSRHPRNRGIIARGKGLAVCQEHILSLEVPSLQRIIHRAAIFAVFSDQYRAHGQPG